MLDYNRIIDNNKQNKMKNLLNEIKAMNKIAGTQMTKEQEIALIKQSLNEAKSSKVKLSSGMQMRHLGGKLYCIEYTKENFEPTIAQAEGIVAKIRKEFSKIQDAVQSKGLNGQATIYIKNEDIAIGIDFNSTLNHFEMDELISGGVEFGPAGRYSTGGWD